jgi:hypothetical protein
MPGGRKGVAFLTPFLPPGCFLPRKADWAIMALGSAGADFRVISPPELLDLAQPGGPP